MTTQRPQSLSEIFNDFASDTAVRLPRLREEIVIFDMNEEKCYTSGLNAKTSGFKSEEHLLRHLKNHDYVRRARSARKKGIFHDAIPSAAQSIPDTPLKVIFINESVPENLRAAVPEDLKKEIYAALDHELAHLSIRNAGYNRNKTPASEQRLGESISDAYALIRHYQRFGVDSTWQDPQAKPSARAVGMLTGDDTHFTSFVTTEIIKRRHLIDFNSLSEQEVAHLAWRFATKYTPPDPVVRVLQSEFQNTLVELRRDDLTGFARKIAEITLNPKSGYYAFTFGSIILNGLLEKRPDLNDPYWANVRAELKRRETALHSDDVLFNIPHTPPALRPDNQPQL